MTVLSDRSPSEAPPPAGPGISRDARLHLSRHARPSKGPVRATEGLKASFRCQPPFSRTPTCHQHTDPTRAPGPAHLGSTQATLPWLSPAHVPGVLPAQLHAPLTALLSQPRRRGGTRAADTIMPPSDSLILSADTRRLPGPCPHTGTAQGRSDEREELEQRSLPSRCSRASGETGRVGATAP